MIIIILMIIIIIVIIKIIKSKFDINSYNSLKWTRPNGYLIGYKFNEAICLLLKIINL